MIPANETEQYAKRLAQHNPLAAGIYWAFVWPYAQHMRNGERGHSPLYLYNNRYYYKSGDAYLPLQEQIDAGVTRYEDPRLFK